MRSASRCSASCAARAADVPAPSFRIGQGDRLICYGAEADTAEDPPEDQEEERHSMFPPAAGRFDSGLRSLLVLGWTRKLPTVFLELCTSDAQLEVTVISTHEVSLRSQDLESVPLGERLKLRHVVADYTIPGVLRAHGPSRYDAVLLVGTNRLETGAESDTRNIDGGEVLKSACRLRARSRAS